MKPSTNMLPSGYVTITIEMVSLPIKHGGSFHSFFLCLQDMLVADFEALECLGMSAVPAAFVTPQFFMNFLRT